MPSLVPFVSASGSNFLRPAGLARIPARFLNLYEYQSKELMDKFNVPTQIGSTASTPAEARDGARRLLESGVETVVLKSQIFAGGRGKGTLSSGLQGGIQFVKDANKAGEIAGKMLGYKLRTHQTGPEGMVVQKLLLTEGVQIDKELYLAFLLDRAMDGMVIVASKEGGVDIEEVSEKHPEAIHKIPVDITKGITKCVINKVCEALIDPEEHDKTGVRKLREQLQSTIQTLYTLFINCDASQVEINPLAITKDGRLLCVDAKLSFDDNADFRQKPLFAQEDKSTRCPRELGAEEMGMNWVSMDGNIGCLVNGAGLAMATMDLIAHNGGSPANFLDLGGGATKEQVLKSFELLTSDPNVKVIFVNIFGGITRCDVVARGIIEAAEQIKMDRPLVVRLVGNNADLAKQLIGEKMAKNDSDLNITYEQDFATAARKVVHMARNS